MARDLDLKQLERKAFRSTFQDGIWDLFLGLVLLSMTFLVLLSDLGVSTGWRYGIYAASQALAVGFFILGKKWITLPRMGSVRFGPERRRKLTRSRLVLLASVLAGAAIWLAVTVIRGNPPAWLHRSLVMPAVWLANCLVVFGLLAHFLDFPRLYLWGVLFGLSLFGVELGKMYADTKLAWIGFAIPGLLIFATGLVLFVRFLRDYPIPAKEVPNGN